VGPTAGLLAVAFLHKTTALEKAAFKSGEPMKFEIGAMSVGDILDRGLKLLWARFGTFYAITFIMLLPIVIAQLLMPDIVVPDIPQPRDPNNREQLERAVEGMLIIFGQLMVLVFLRWVLILLATAATLHVTAGEYVDRHVGIGEAFGHLVRRLGPLLGSSFLAWLVVLLSACLCVLPGVLLVPVMGGGPMAALILLITICMGVVIASIRAIWYVFVPQVVVLEGSAGPRALGRSKALTEGFRWRIFGMFILLSLIQVGMQMLAQVLGMILPPAEQIPAGDVLRQEVIPGNYEIYVVLTSLVEVVAESYTVVCWTLFYFDLRIRKEGFDLELMAQRESLSLEGARDIPVEVVDEPPPKDERNPWLDNRNPY
jgi:hypothetical protein